MSEIEDRVSRLERKVFPPDCPTRWNEWICWFETKMELLPRIVGDFSKTVPTFKGKQFGFCPFCGETLPHKEPQ